MHCIICILLSAMNYIHFNFLTGEACSTNTVVCLMYDVCVCVFRKRIRPCNNRPTDETWAEAAQRTSVQQLIIAAYNGSL